MVDMIVKSNMREGHFEALEKFKQRVGKYNLRLNPNKCVFGATSVKVLGFMICPKGI